MPELPEVETIRLGLQKYLVGHEILNVEVRDTKIFQGDKKNIIGAKVKGVKRFGKGLVIDLDNSYSIATHIKLTGQFIYRDEKTQKVPVSQELVNGLPSKFTRVIFKLDKGADLFFNDVRRFAWMKIIKTDQISALPFFKELGPEPFKDLTFARFKFVVGKKVTKIKPLLMDQTNMGGIGNIYANDALFRAGIDPRRPGKSLSEKELRKLYDSILFVLKKGLKSHGASELSFVNILGQEGAYQNHTLVYGKRGQKCPNCGSPIKFIRIAGRGTYFCPNCQK